MWEWKREKRRAPISLSLFSIRYFIASLSALFAHVLLLSSQVISHRSNLQWSKQSYYYVWVPYSSALSLHSNQCSQWGIKLWLAGAKPCLLVPRSFPFNLVPRIKQTNAYKYDSSDKAVSSFDHYPQTPSWRFLTKFHTWPTENWKYVGLEPRWFSFFAQIIAGCTLADTIENGVAGKQSLLRFRNWIQLIG